ncbi:hypothetical protein [Humibacillus xanthopallidus]|uniref:hypothetical protein n=1 Tax=Humibacillus xanthopallidus TaxID=412689 RepID=UPI00384C482C
MIHSKVTVVFCGEEHSVSPEAGLTIGRSGDLEIDDNPYLHRTFLVVSFDNGFWWLSNTGSTLTATVADEQGLFQAWLSPGARIPLAMKTLVVWFTAGPTTYDFEIHVASPVFQSVTSDPVETGLDSADDVGAATVGRVSLTPDQKLLVLALCEPFLLRREAGTSQIPSSSAAAERLGWTLTRFNRKLDNVCQKLADAGTRGLHGGVGKLASNRKARLVEHGLSTKLVSEDDLALLQGLGTTDVATGDASTTRTHSTTDSTTDSEKVAGTPVVAAEQGRT